MYTKPNPSKNMLLSSLVVTLLISLACGSSTPFLVQPTEVNNQVQVDPTKFAATMNTPEPAPSPTPASVGLSRSNPYPRTELVSVLNWDFQILEVRRGEDVWKDILVTGDVNRSAPEGSEYLVLRLYVKCTSSDYFPDSNFLVTGDGLVGYSAEGWQGISRNLQLGGMDLLEADEEFETWASYIIPEDESKLILVFDDPTFLDESDVRYVAIDDEASVGVPSELSSIQPNNLGKEGTTPASLNEKMITEDWELSILELVRGAEALEIVQKANNYVPWYPNEGFDVIVMKLHVRYINQVDRIKLFEPSLAVQFNDVEYFNFYPYVPAPSITAWFFPGGEHEGWIVHSQIPIGDANFDLVIDLYGDRRYVSLEP